MPHYFLFYHNDSVLYSHVTTPFLGQIRVGTGFCSSSFILYGFATSSLPYQCNKQTHSKTNTTPCSQLYPGSSSYSTCNTVWLQNIHGLLHLPRNNVRLQNIHSGLYSTCNNVRLQIIHGPLYFPRNDVIGQNIHGTLYFLRNDVIGQNIHGPLYFLRNNVIGQNIRGPLYFPRNNVIV